MLITSGIGNTALAWKTKLNPVETKKKTTTKKQAGPSSAKTELELGFMSFMSVAFREESKEKKSHKYQPSGTGDTRSLPATPYRQLNPK